MSEVLKTVSETLAEPRYPDPVTRPVRRKRFSGLGASRILIWALVAFNVGVLVFAVISSFKPSKEIFDNPWGLPIPLDLSNWVTAWEQGGFGQALLNTTVLTLVTAVACVVIAAPASYMLARVVWIPSRAMLAIFVFGISIPIQVIVIPLFVFMAGLGLTNSLVGLALVYIGLGMPLSVFFLTAFFSSLPEELEEAASLDGAGLVRTFVLVVLPLARSGLITVFILNAVNAWSETLVALIFLQDNAIYTLPITLLSFMTTMQFSGGDYGGLFAGICIVVAPILGLYIFAGRRIIEGMSVGAGK